MLRQLQGAKLATVKLIASDWSGVISDDRLPVYESNMRVLEAHGIKRFTFNEWLPRTQLSPIELFANAGLTGDRDLLFEEYRVTLAAVRGEGVNPIVYTDAKSVLKFLAGTGVQMVVISSHPEDHLLEEAGEYGVRGYFTMFVGNVSDKTVALEKVCRDTEHSPSNTAYLGDTIFDIQAARGAGVISVGVASGYHTRDRLACENPDLLVDTLTEFQEAVVPLLRP